jgi:hypothetical protein
LRSPLPAPGPAAVVRFCRVRPLFPLEEAETPLPQEWTPLISSSIILSRKTLKRLQKTFFMVYYKVV